ncbi:MAG TPA: translation elongation factor Ts [Thermodesulfovibrionia bacterium]|nr:translation elongation factor Ts [Thermodesulfovibrionia bacterium]
MSISAEDVRKLRNQTGAGMMECKQALVEAEGDPEKAIELLRKKGLSLAARKAGRTTGQGLVGSYIHMGKIGVLVELNCETDFVAKTSDFRELLKDIAMHIAAANPQYIRREEVPQPVIEKESEIYKAQLENKPPQVVEKIIAGKLEKFYSDTCLMDQVFIKDPEHKKKIHDLVTEHIAKLGENILIRRIARFEIGA